VTFLPEPPTPQQWQRALDHRGLVRRVVNHTIRNHDERDDALQDGFLGLCRAIQLDDGRPGFTKYANVWIREGIRQGRRRREGSGYRSDLNGHRRHQWPLSIDADITDHTGETITYADTTAASDDTEAQALATVTLSRYHQALAATARDAIDLDIGYALLRLDGIPLAHQDEVIAITHLVSPSTIAKRRDGLRRRLHGLLAAA
jgi:DNA-directed RNA polymerase specialized sigma24 family protein